MSVQRAVEELQHLGMTGYEAKAYVALVGAGAPVNGYEVAKRSGVPRSAVYETLGKLVGRGAAFEVRSDDDGVGYVPLPPEALLDRMRRNFDASLTSLEADLPGVASPDQAQLVHPVNERSALFARAHDVVTAAASELFVSGWPDDLAEVKPALRAAEEAGVRVSAVVLGCDEDPVGWTVEHRWPRPERVEAEQGYRLLVVVADRAQAVVGGTAGDRTWGLYTDDPATVLLAVDFVRRDIALHRVAERFDDREIAEFLYGDPVIRRLHHPEDRPWRCSPPGA